MPALAESTLDKFLTQACGVVHVGANIGQERELYAGHNLPVLWVEPIPAVFRTLQTNIAPYPNQRAIQALVTEHDGDVYHLNVTSNHGASSSVFLLRGHSKAWPRITVQQVLTLTGISLATLLKGGAAATYDALIIDVQGAELLVLRGALPILPRFRWVKVEAPDFEAYAGGSQERDVAEFMQAQGHRERGRDITKTKIWGWNYYDILYERV